MQTQIGNIKHPQDDDDDDDRKERKKKKLSNGSLSRMDNV